MHRGYGLGAQLDAVGSRCKRVTVVVEGSMSRTLRYVNARRIIVDNVHFVSALVDVLVKGSLAAAASLHRIDAVVVAGHCNYDSVGVKSAIVDVVVNRSHCDGPVLREVGVIIVHVTWRKLKVARATREVHSYLPVRR